MATDISNTDDIIDSRDVIARIEELESELETLTDAVDEAREALTALDDLNTAEELEEAEDTLKDAESDLADWDGEEELKTLKALADQCEGCGDWGHGESLIRDSYFEEYAEQLADDIGAIDRNAKWPVNCIDWEKAARELQYDYTEVDFDGEAYWIRA
jgi:DNA repair exonuclease SbcCD ATPase subunit